MQKAQPYGLKGSQQFRPSSTACPVESKAQWWTPPKNTERDGLFSDYPPIHGSPVYEAEQLHNKVAYASLWSQHLQAKVGGPRIPGHPELQEFKMKEQENHQGNWDCLSWSKQI